MRATNAAGSAVQSFAVTVRAVATVVRRRGGARRDELRLRGRGARLEPRRRRLRPAGRRPSEGRDPRALEPVRRRRALPGAGALDAPATAVDRPFSFSARLAAGGQRLPRAARSTPSQRTAPPGSTCGSTPAPAPPRRRSPSAAVAWANDAWTWVELELDGATVRARLYPEAAAGARLAGDGDDRPTSSAGAAGIGGFGRLRASGRRSTSGGSSSCRRSAPAPAAADAGEWTLEQRVERQA